MLKEREENHENYEINGMLYILVYSAKEQNDISKMKTQILTFIEILNIFQLEFNFNITF